MYVFYVAAIWAVAVITPGPNFFVVTRTALGGSRNAAVAAVAGVSLGTLGWGLAGWLGIAGLFTAAPLAYTLLKIAGGAYLVWVGLKLFVLSWRSEQSSGQTMDGPRIGAYQAFYLGLMTNLANPKSALFVAGLFAATLPADHTWVQGALTVGTMVVLSATWYTTVLLFLRRPIFARALSRARRQIDRAAGALFVGFGVKLLSSIR